MIDGTLLGMAQRAAKGPITSAHLMAIISVECAGRGFDPSTGKILIQFEPHIFARLTKLPMGTDNAYMWDENRVDVQSKEWPAFNDAFKLNPEAAMMATSIGLPQILGQHWARLGYKSVGAMWDEFKVGEYLQVQALVRFLETDAVLRNALIAQDWDGVARRYNGSKYKALALKLNREPYDVSLQQAYARFSGVKA